MSAQAFLSPPGKHLTNSFPIEDSYQQLLSICKLQTGRPWLRRFPRKQASRDSPFWAVVAMGGQRGVSFPKVIIRPHFKKENLRLFGGGNGEKICKSEESKEWRWWRAEPAFLGQRRLENSGVDGEGRATCSLHGAGQGQNQRQREGRTQVAQKKKKTPSSLLRGVYTVFCLQGEK